MFFLKFLSVWADDDDMEPLESERDRGLPAPRTVDADVPSRLRMYPWRLLAAAGVGSAFGFIGLQVQRAISDQPRSDALTSASAIAGVVAGVAVLIWTWSTTENARRLVSPASNQDLPDPMRAVLTWILPFSFIASASFVLAILASRLDSSPDESASSIPLALAVGAILLAIPLTYRPVHYMASVVRQVGGYSANLAQWMWVPVTLAVVGVGSIVVMRSGGLVVDDSSGEWAPLWIIAVVAIAPCIIVLLLAWRAAESVEEAIVLAFRRRGDQSSHRPSPGNTPAGSGGTDASTPRPVQLNARRRVRQLGGANIMRLAIVTLLAGLALLSMVGAIVMFLFWQEANEAVLLRSQNAKAWDTLDALHRAERGVAFTLVGLVTLWTFITVLNARLASGRRRNPLLAALAWPAAGAGVWAIADRLIVDQSTGSVVAGLAAQAALLYVPFFLLERAADVVGARRTPLRITYVFGVVLLVYIQGLGGLSNVTAAAQAEQYGRLAIYLALGALVQLLSTLAVTEASTSISKASSREAEQQNLLVERLELTERQSGAVDPQSVGP